MSPNSEIFHPCRWLVLPSSWKWTVFEFILQMITSSFIISHPIGQSKLPNFFINVAPMAPFFAARSAILNPRKGYPRTRHHIRMPWFEQPLTCQFFAKRLSEFVNRIGSSHKRFCISWFKATESIICRSKIFISIFSWSFYWFFINRFWIWSFCRFWTFIFAFWLSSRWFSFRTSAFRLFFDFNGLNIITSLIYVCTPYW